MEICGINKVERPLGALLIASSATILLLSVLFVAKIWPKVAVSSQLRRFTPLILASSIGGATIVTVVGLLMLCKESKDARSHR